MGEIDVNQVIYSLQRTAETLGEISKRLLAQGDYGAEFPAQEAENLLDAVKLLDGTAGVVLIPAPVVKFLAGEGELDGRYMHQFNYDLPQYWWRSHLPTLRKEDEHAD